MTTGAVVHGIMAPGVGMVIPMVAVIIPTAATATPVAIIPMVATVTPMVVTGIRLMVMDMPPMARHMRSNPRFRSSLRPSPKASRQDRLLVSIFVQNPAPMSGVFLCLHNIKSCVGDGREYAK